MVFRNVLHFILNICSTSYTCTKHYIDLWMYIYCGIYHLLRKPESEDKEEVFATTQLVLLVFSKKSFNSERLVYFLCFHLVHKNTSWLINIFQVVLNVDLECKNHSLSNRSSSNFLINNDNQTTKRLLLLLLFLLKYFPVVARKRMEGSRSRHSAMLTSSASTACLKRNFAPKGCCSTLMLGSIIPAVIQSTWIVMVDRTFVSVLPRVFHGKIEFRLLRLFD